MDLSVQSKKAVCKLINSLIFASTPSHAMWNIEQKVNNTANRWNYVDGCMILAFLSLYDATGNKKYLDFSDSFADAFVTENGNIKTFDPDKQSLDDINEAKILIPLYELTGKEKYRKAAGIAYHSLRAMPRTLSGNFWHKKIYPNQVWLDGFYMAMPFYMAYETKYNNMRYCLDIFRQFQNASQNMRDVKTGLYYHGFDESRSAAWADPVTGCSRSFWLRADGWFLMAIVDTLEQMDEQIYAEYRILGNIFRNLIDSILPYQQKNGMFYQVVDHAGEAENYLETSGTCMVSYSILKAVRLGFLPKCYIAFAKKAFEGTLSTYFRSDENSPVLGGICLSAGLGGKNNRDGTPEYYYSEPAVENDGKGLAPFLLTFAELLRIPKNAFLHDDSKPYIGREDNPELKGENV